MIVHCIETGRELTSDDAGHRRGSSPCPSLEGGTISRWSRHLATVITDTASTARDVLVEEGFYEAALAVLTDILEATTPKPTINCSPAGIAVTGTTPILRRATGDVWDTQRTRSPESSTPRSPNSSTPAQSVRCRRRSAARGHALPQQGLGPAQVGENPGVTPIEDWAVQQS